MIDNFIPIFDWVKDIVVMIIFVNPKFNLPKWLKYVLLAISGLIIFLCLLGGLVDIVISFFEYFE